MILAQSYSVLCTLIRLVIGRLKKLHLDKQRFYILLLKRASFWSMISTETVLLILVQSKEEHYTPQRTISHTFCFLLLTHEGSHREVYQEFQPSYDFFRRWCQGLFRPRVLCTPSLHCPIANSASTQRQQPV